LVISAQNGAGAAWAGEDIDILAPDNLIQLINHVNGTQVLSAPKPALAAEPDVLPDLRDIKGQESSKRALEVAAAGRHHLLMLWTISKLYRDILFLFVIAAAPGVRPTRLWFGRCSP
jgi:magnesium chelatase family protein